MPAPRYLRFAQSLALCSSLAMLPACPSSMTGSDAGDDGDTSSGTDAPSLDAPIAELDTPTMMGADTGATDAPADDEDAPIADAGMTDAGLDCADCDCFDIGGEDAGRPSCFEIGLESCCIAVGPLSPPDLPA